MYASCQGEEYFYLIPCHVSKEGDGYYIYFYTYDYNVLYQYSLEIYSHSSTFYKNTIIIPEIEGNVYGELNVVIQHNIPDNYISTYTASQIINVYIEYQVLKVIGTYIDTSNNSSYPLKLIYLHQSQHTATDMYDYVILSASSNDSVFYFTITDTDDGSTVSYSTICLENSSNKVITIDSESTNQSYPSAKCVYDAIEESRYNYVEGETVCGTYMGEQLFRYCYTKPEECYIGNDNNLELPLIENGFNIIIVRIGATGGNGNLLNGGIINNRVVLNSPFASTYFPAYTTFWVEYTKLFG